MASSSPRGALEGVGAPVDAGHVAAGGGVGCQLVELAAHRQRRAVVGLKRQAVQASAPLGSGSRSSRRTAP